MIAPRGYESCITLLLLISSGSLGFAASPGDWSLCDSPTDASLRGLSAVGKSCAWISGAKGTVLRTTDAGVSFQQIGPSGTNTHDFRDIHAFDPSTASLLTAGQPAEFFHTADAGKTWTLAYENSNPKLFFNAMDFWDAQRGIAFSDPIDGKLVLIETKDGGKSWQNLASGPQTLPGEQGYAASGSCLAVAADGHVWIGLGGRLPDDSPARVHHSSDFGRTWSVSASKLVSTESAGIFSLLSSGQQLIVIGGDYKQPDATESTITIQQHSLGWNTHPKHGLRGFRSSIAHAQSANQMQLIATGPNGTDFSTDNGHTWQPASDHGFNTIDFTPTRKFGWAVGSDGRIATWKWDH